MTPEGGGMCLSLACCRQTIPARRSQYMRESRICHARFFTNSPTAATHPDWLHDARPPAADSSSRIPQTYTNNKLIEKRPTTQSRMMQPVESRNSQGDFQLRVFSLHEVVGYWSRAIHAVPTLIQSRCCRWKCGLLDPVFELSANREMDHLAATG